MTGWRSIKSLWSLHKTLFLSIVCVLLFLPGAIILYNHYQASYFDEETHLFLQEKAQELIAQEIEKKQKGLKELIFQNIWTKEDSRSRVQLFFTYSLVIEDGLKSGRVSVKGEAMIYKESNENWIIRDIKTQGISVDFLKPLVIQANPS